MSLYEKQQRYVKRNPGKRKLSNKLSWMKKLYGSKAKEHFLNHPFCQSCGEKRLACLAIHHPKGKKVEEFQTLCHNCHAVVHNGEVTITDINGPVV